MRKEIGWMPVSCVQPELNLTILLASWVTQEHNLPPRPRNVGPRSAQVCTASSTFLVVLYVKHFLVFIFLMVSLPSRLSQAKTKYRDAMCLLKNGVGWSCKCKAHSKAIFTGSAHLHPRFINLKFIVFSAECYQQFGMLQFDGTLYFGRSSLKHFFVHNMWTLKMTHIFF